MDDSKIFEGRRKYKLFNIISLDDAKAGKELYSSDYTLPIKTESGEIHLAQFAVVESEDPKIVLENKAYTVAESNSGLVLNDLTIKDDPLLEVNSLHFIIEKQIDLFFNHLDIFDEIGQKIKRRSVMVHSKPGAGKSSQIYKVINKYIKQKNVLVMNWPSDKIDAGDLSYFMNNRCDFSKVSGIILVIEDIGGKEVDPASGIIPSGSSMLNFLDGMLGLVSNNPPPMFIISTTNAPDNLVAPLLRPGRFDLTLKVPDLTAEEKLNFFKFFCKDRYNLSLDMEDNLLHHADKFLPAHIKEVYIRARLDQLDSSKEEFPSILVEKAKEMSEWIEKQETGQLAAGTKKKSVAFEF